MQQKVLHAARELVDRAAKAGRHGVTVPHVELDCLIPDLGVPFPQWLRELFEIVPLCGIELGWQAFEPDADYNGIATVEWSDASGIRSESLECYPGCAILDAGYVNVGGDASGGGDPYFVNVNEGEDPPLYQIYHDMGDHPAKVIAEGRRVVSVRLSEFFASARVTA